jgi:hypothetical protein
MKKLILTAIALFSIAALSASAYPPPEKDEITIAELESKLFQYDGKVVEVQVTYGHNMQQFSSTKSRIYCYFYTGAGGALEGGRLVTFTPDEDAVEFFEDLSKKDYGAGRTSFYVYVDGTSVIAIGEKWKKSKGTYSW